MPHLGKRRTVSLSADHHRSSCHRRRRRRRLRECEAPGRVDFSKNPNPGEKVWASVSRSAIGSSLCLGRNFRRNERRPSLHRCSSPVSARLFSARLRREWHHLQRHRRRNHPGMLSQPDKSLCVPVPFRSLRGLASLILGKVSSGLTHGHSGSRYFPSCQSNSSEGKLL